MGGAGHDGWTEVGSTDCYVGQMFDASSIVSCVINDDLCYPLRSVSLRSVCVIYAMMFVRAMFLRSVTHRFQQGSA